MSKNSTKTDTQRYLTEVKNVPFGATDFMNNIYETLNTHPKNTPVLNHLSNQNAHSDLAYFFFEKLRALSKATIYAPDDYPFPFNLVYANGSIFGFCTGMQAISLKLPLPLIEIAKADGGWSNSFLADDGWLDFPVYDPNSKPDHDRWIKHAYREALR